MKHTGWVWTKKAEARWNEGGRKNYPAEDRSAGDMVPAGHLIKGDEGTMFPRQAWVQKGYVRREESPC